MQADLRQHIEKVIPLQENEFTIIKEHFISKDFKKRDFIIHEDEQVPYCYFVVSGLLMLGHRDQKGKQHIVSFAMDDWWETDFAAYYTLGKATMSLQCLEDTTVLCLSLESYRALCSSIPKMQHFFLEKSIAGHIASQRRILSFITSNAGERFEQLLRIYPALLQRVPKTLLASFLGVSRETLSRLSS